MTPEQRKEALELAKRRILHQSDAHRGYIDLFLVANALIAAESELSTQRRESVPIGKGVGFDEVYCEWFKCGACGDSGCGLAMKYCPNCGRKLRWPDVSSLREEAKQLATAINEADVQREAAEREVDAARGEANRLREAIENAPHPDYCAGWHKHSRYPNDPIWIGVRTDKCNCWKGGALADPPCSKPGSDEETGCADDGLSRGVVDAIREKLKPPCNTCGGTTLVCSATGRRWDKCDCGNCERGAGLSTCCPDCQPAKGKQ